MFKPSRFAVKTGTATSETSFLNAVDKAMIEASVGEYNLIEVSSVLPAGTKRVDDFSEHRGAFLPAVISKNTGSGKELSAGLAWGFRKDGKGGYVMEDAKEKESIDDKALKENLEEMLIEMGETRGVKLEKIDIKYDKVKVEADKYGCAIAALVYLP